MRTITETLITELIEQAAQSPRKRTIYRLHEHEEPVQRMINALVPGTYITPHKHGQPPKVELLSIVRGRVAALHFTPEGHIAGVYLLDAAGELRIVDIPPGEYHCMVALTPCAVLEIVQGPYDAATHKQFADWAPHEGQPGTETYLQQLEAHIHHVISEQS
ncbi:MAG: WbuC family cupin fold metalloprotein [Anaerolineae bacterium]